MRTRKKYRIFAFIIKKYEQNFQIYSNSNFEFIAYIQEMKEEIDELRIKLREKISILGNQ